MGKSLIQQARGKGGPSYVARSFRYKSSAKHPATARNGTITDFVKCPGHSAPLAEVTYEDGTIAFLIAPEGVRVGDPINATPQADPRVSGSILALANIPEGTNIYNIESQPGDGGKFCRTSGNAARLISKTDQYAIVVLPSRRERQFLLSCRASIGTIAGGGRKEKPFLKAGTRHHAKRMKNKRYPMISGAAQNAVDHPFGNKRTSRKAKQRPAPRFAPAGRKVGKLHPTRTGRKK
ncbi:50S ribosomal protein L2 [Candidatus Woesearchaeota archaeon]|nr:50S ribosomal protein L2 [Candidatus Woesearchaeota archaeon]